MENAVEPKVFYSLYLLFSPALVERLCYN